MICENTISAGFYFMLGKFLFEFTLSAVMLAVLVAFFAWMGRDRK
jgi:hypothetical protein